MAKYTTQLRTIIESGYDIFDFEYPIFKEGYDKLLNQKIIDTYYFREIGFETLAQFKWFLKNKMQRIMPYYNQMYESTGLISKDDYFINQNSVETHTRNVSQTSSGTVSSTASSDAASTSEDIFSDTPQSKLGGLDYATSLTESTASSNDSSKGSSLSTGTADTTETFTIELTGGGGLRYNADILMEWRKSFINVDQMIIDELNDLFMNVY